MKLSDYRKRAYQYMGVDPKTYNGPVLLPSQMYGHCDYRRDHEMLFELGRMHLQLLNRRKSP